MVKLGIEKRGNKIHLQLKNLPKVCDNCKLKDTWDCPRIFEYMDFPESFFQHDMFCPYQKPVETYPISLDAYLFLFIKALREYHGYWRDAVNVEKVEDIIRKDVKLVVNGEQVEIKL